MTTNPAFDFWLGRWEVTDAAEGSIGTNTIRRILGGAVIEERFAIAGPDGKPYRGRSHTAYVEGRGWCQTWVDTTGLYLDFVGAATDGGMTLERTAALDGKPVTQRMQWSDITADSLVWQWMRAPEGSDEFELLCRLDYRRTG
ncbi:MAG: hypothetical protein JJD92_03635 [Frankiaceae bacterium]|nr:hypothetical protein [Frankiaceae bacterium]